MDEHDLVRRAVEAREKAYCPYSGFPVGAALLSSGGEVYTGSNVENASLGLTVCAERAALFGAVSAGERDFRALAVACGQGACTPCGACRQVLLEFAPELWVIMADARGNVHLQATLSELVPHPFGPGRRREQPPEQNRPQ